MSSSSDFISTVMSSALAGLIARTICHPIDTIKAKLQSRSGDEFKSISDVVRRTMRREGLAGFYRGLSAVVVGGVPGVCLYMTSYEEFKHRLQSMDVHPFLSYLLSGLLAEAVCCTVFTPVDVVKERLQVQSDQTHPRSQQSSTHYSGSLDALRTIIREEGWRGIYKGYGATIFSYGPFSACYFVIYEESKHLMKTYSSSSTRASASSSSSGGGMVDHQKVPDGSDLFAQLSFQQNLICSSLAASISSFITTPLDFAKLRYQIQRSQVVEKHHDSGPMYRGLWDALVQLHGQYGWRGLYRGALARTLFFTPSSALTMAIYEELKAYL